MFWIMLALALPTAVVIVWEVALLVWELLEGAIIATGMTTLCTIARYRRPASDRLGWIVFHIPRWWFRFFLSFMCGEFDSLKYAHVGGVYYYPLFRFKISKAH